MAGRAGADPRGAKSLEVEGLSQVDVNVKAMPDGKSWSLTDLLGRDMGRVAETQPGVFRIQPEGNAIATFAAILSRSFRSLDDALAAIEETYSGCVPSRALRRRTSSAAARSDPCRC